MLARRLSLRGVVLSSGSVGAVLSAGSASASAPPALVASTIQAASLLAAGQAAGVVSAKVAALTEGVVQAMFVTKMKSVLAVVLVVGLALGGVAGLLYQTQAADQPKGGGVSPAAKKDQKDEKGRPMTKEEPVPENAKTEQKVLTPEEAIKQGPKEKVTVQFKVVAVQAMPNPGSGFGGPNYYIFLHDGGKFTARLARAADQFMKLGIEPVKHFTGKVVRVTGRVEPDSGKPSFQMWVREITDIEVMDRAF
jgi:DNA/RNA endonuclease YhcR with UshA esterase domain